MHSKSLPFARSWLPGLFRLTLLLAAGVQTSAAQTYGLVQPAITADGLLLQWTELATAQGYRIEYRDQLGTGAWLPCPPQDQWPIDGTQWTDPAPLASSARFYRVMALQTVRGAVASWTSTGTLTTQQLAGLFALFEVPIEPQFAVTSYVLAYQTLTPDGAPTLATGVVMVPENAGRPLPLLSHQHGTVILTNDVPSAGSSESMVGLAWATLGYVTAMPDYLGMGGGTGLHPYVHARSAATAVVDLLRASRTICAQLLVPLNGQLFLVGYSQGGQATMAAHREIETHHTNEFTLTASAPMAGPHDLSGTMADRLASDQAYDSPYYLPYVLFAYNNVYRLYDSVALALRDPYNTTLPPLFDGQHTGGQINAEMPAVASQILRPDFLAAFRTDANHPFRAALRRNDLYDWRPRAPMRLYHCHGDTTVPFTNSQVAQARFHANGATHVQLIDPFPLGDHGGCAVPAFQAAQAWFATLTN